jgi:hypothetical protein
MSTSTRGRGHAPRTSARERKRSQSTPVFETDFEPAEPRRQPAEADPRKTAGKTLTLDPLYVIFEQHLYNFQDSEIDRKTFIGNVLQDYVSHLRKLDITIPKPLEQPVFEELASQVNTMLVKKIYGCLSIGEYQRKVPTSARRRAKAKYSKLGTRRA